MQEEAQQEKGPLPHTREAVDWWLKKWGRQAVLDGKEPLKSEDEERLIEVNGGTAEKLDLHRRDLRHVDLSRANLQGINLAGTDLSDESLTRSNLQNANLMEANLARADLSGANLEGANLLTSDLCQAILIEANLRGAALGDACLFEANLEGAILTDALLSSTDLRQANLQYAELQGANLDRANLQNASLYMANMQSANLGRAILDNTNLQSANLQDADLFHVQISSTTNLEDVKWGPGHIIALERQGNYEVVIPLYRKLKRWYQEAGMLSIAGEFHYREWECKRKLAQQERNWFEIGEFWLYRLLSGYGERPKRVIAFGIAVILIFSLAYFPFSWSFCWASECWGAFWKGIWKSLYFSGVSFTALGYGDWVKAGNIAPVGWPRFLGVVEALFGISLIALFLVTFTRKMTR